jgi:hypothetical protein
MDTETQKKREGLMDQLQETRNYEKFELLNFNRDVKKTRNLEASMKEYGFLSPYPLHVQRNGNGKLKIKAGHHRFYVARQLGIPVKYVISNDDISIYQLEKATNPWSMQDYLESHCRRGLPEYLKVKRYCDETGIPVNLAIAMLGGNTAGTANFTEAFKTGTYKVKGSSSHAEMVKDLVLCLKGCGVKFYNTALLVQGFSRCVWLKEFSVNKMKSKMRTFHGLMEKKADLNQSLIMLEDIYNRQSREKIPLRFLAEEAAKGRNLIPLKNRSGHDQTV